MKIDREYLVGILSLIVGTVSLPLWYISYLSTRDADISRKITSALNLLPKCSFDSEKTKHIGDTLLQAQKAIDIEGNYDTAASLLNSLTNDLYSCKPLLQANPDLMLITVFVMFVLFGSITIIRYYRQKYGEKRQTKINLQTETIKPALKEQFQKSNLVKQIQILFLTPLVTTVFLPIVFVGLIPITLLRLSELGNYTFDIGSFMIITVFIVPILNTISLYSLTRSPLDLLRKFKEEYYIINYNVMKYAFPTQIVIIIIIFSILSLNSSSKLTLTSGESTILVLTLLYLLWAVIISVGFFIVVQLNSKYLFVMAQANCKLFADSKKDLHKVRYLVHTIKYYNQFIRENFKITLNVMPIVIKKFLTDDEFKKELSENLLPAFEAGETKPLEFFLTKLKVDPQNILLKPSMRDQIITWSPIAVGIVSVIITIIQTYVNK